MVESDRLLLRTIAESDYDFTQYFLSDPERTRYLPLEKPYPEDKVREWLNNRILHWQNHGFGTSILVEKESSHDIGFCGLEYVGDSQFIDIRYGLIQDWWGKGYAFEVASLCIKNGFEQLGLETIYGAAVPENLPSIYILKKIGMEPDSSFDYYGDVVDSYSITKGRYLLPVNSSK